MNDSSAIPEDQLSEVKDVDMPAPEWAMGELMGHRQRAGLCREVTRFGAALLRIDVYDQKDQLVRSEHYGGSAIFSYTVCTEATAKEYGQRMRDWETPAPYDALTHQGDGDDPDEDEEHFLHESD